jgi:hypothetical protein
MGKKQRTDKKKTKKALTEARKAMKRGRLPASNVDPLDKTYRTMGNKKQVEPKPNTKVTSNIKSTMSDVISELEKAGVGADVTVNITQEGDTTQVFTNQQSGPNPNWTYGNQNEQQSSSDTKSESKTEDKKEDDLLKRPNVFMRGIRSLLNKASGARESMFGSKVATEDQKEIRKQFQKVAQQAVILQNIIQDNSSLLAEKAKQDKDVAALLKEVKENKELVNILEKVSNGQELYGGELMSAAEFMQRITKTLDKTGISLEMGLHDAIEALTKFTNNTELDVGARRQSFEDMQKLLGKMKIKTDSVEKLLAIDSKRLNFTEQENADIASTLKGIRNEMEEGKIQDIKMTGTVRELNNTLGSVVLTNSELKAFMEEKDAKGDSMLEKLKGGLGAQGKGIKGGLIGTLGAAMGVPGLDMLLGDASELIGLGQDAWKGGKGLLKGGKALIGKGAGLFGKGAGLLGKGADLAEGVSGVAGRGIFGMGQKAMGAGAGMLGKMGGMGGLLKGGGKLLGKAALPLALAMAAFDFHGGYKDAANISGKDEKDVTTGDKIQAGVSGMLEGLSFGLVDAKSIFKGIDDGIEFFIGPDGILTQMWEGLKGIGKKIGSLFDLDAITKSLMDGFDAVFGEKGFFGGAKGIIDKIVGFMEMTPIGMLIKGAMKIGDWLVGSGKGDQIPVAAGGASSLPMNLDTRSFGMMSSQEKEDRNMQRGIFENSGKSNTVVVQSPQSNNQQKGASRASRIDDLGLAVINSSMMDR